MKRFLLSTVFAVVTVAVFGCCCGHADVECSRDRDCNDREPPHRRCVKRSEPKETGRTHIVDCVTKQQVVVETWNEIEQVGECPDCPKESRD